MKQMQEFSVQSDFSFSVPARIDSSGFSLLSSRLKRTIDYLAANRSNLLITIAATIGITTLVLAASYLFFVQLAAYGW